MIFHSCLVSNSRFQDVVKKFSNFLTLFQKWSIRMKKNSVSYFRIIFPPLSLCTTSYGYTLHWTKQTRTTARNMKNIPLLFFCPVSDTWKYRTNAGIETQPRSSVFNSFNLTMRDISTWRFFFPCALNIIARKDCLVWEQQKSCYIETGEQSIFVQLFVVG